MANLNQTIVIPEILTANTYFWKSSQSASGRRSNEIKRQNQVSEFFKENGFEVEINGDNVTATKGELKCVFHYSETCKNVYKLFSIYKSDKKSNITQLKKVLGI